MNVNILFSPGSCFVQDHLEMKPWLLGRSIKGLYYLHEELLNNSHLTPFLLNKNKVVLVAANIIENLLEEAKL